MTNIYALVDPRTDEIRYVGKANDPNARLREHRWSAQHPVRGQTHCGAWLRQLIAEGIAPVIQVLETVPRDQWENAERRWISFLRGKGVRLVNSTDGGEGGYVGPEATARATEKRRGRKHSEETRRRMSDASRGVAKSPEHVEAVRQALKGRTNADATGDKNPSAKLTVDQVIELRQLANAGWSNRRLAERYDLTTQNVWNIVTRRTWKHLPATA